MTATLPFVTDRFDRFNKLCFEGALPPLPISIGRSRSCLGQIRYKRVPRAFRKPVLTDFRMIISSMFDLPEEELEDVVIHEMIHYHILLNGIKDTSTHGKVFREIMEGINARFGRHITVTHRLTAAQREQIVDNRKKVHLVAAVDFSDGRTGIKVLPRTGPSAGRYVRTVRRAPGVSGVRLYLTENVFFNRFPVSGAFRVHFLSPDERSAALEGSRHALAISSLAMH